MLAAYILIAFFIAWVWIDYYRLIDIYEKEELKYILFTFFFGGLSAFLVLNLEQYVFHTYTFELNGHWYNDLLYSIFKIGLVEEIAKAIPFVIVMFLFSKQLNDPIDYIAFFCISALGFAATENILYFFYKGSTVIGGRAILSTVGHMFDSAIVAYGIVLVKYRNLKPSWIVIPGFLLLAAISHGFYDFWLLYEEANEWGWIVTLFYFLFTLSIFSTMLNNALNISSFFNYKHLVRTNRVAGRLMLYYLIIFILQTIVLTIETNIYQALGFLTQTVFFTGIIVIIATVRLSRFKLIKDRWEWVKFELPFSFYRGELDGDVVTSSVRFRIKGESFCEANISMYYKENFYLNPVSGRNTWIGDQRLAYMQEKLFLEYDQTVYIIKIFSSNNLDVFDTIALKPKTSGMTEMYDKYPIVGLYKIEESVLKEGTLKDLSIKQLGFLEWAYMMPMEEG